MQDVQLDFFVERDRRAAEVCEPAAVAHEHRLIYAVVGDIKEYSVRNGGELVFVLAAISRSK